MEHETPVLDPPMPHLDGVNHRWLDLSGVRLHVAEAAPSEARSPGEETPFLLLHGFPQHWWEWRDVIPRIAAHRRTVAVDLRGAGWSGAPENSYAAGDFVGDVLAALDALGLDRVHVLSHDFGSIVGYHVALTAPERVASHISTGVPPLTVRPHPRWMVQMWRGWFQGAIASPLGPRLLSRGGQRLPRHLLRTDAADPPTWSPADLEHFLAPLRDPARARAGAETYRRLILPAGMQLLRSDTDKLSRRPTLVLVGAQDPVAGRMVHHGYTPGSDPNVTVGLVEGASHFLVDEQPGTVAERALAFATQVETAETSAA